MEFPKYIVTREYYLTRMHRRHNCRTPERGPNVPPRRVCIDPRCKQVQVKMLYRIGDKVVGRWHPE